MHPAHDTQPMNNDTHPKIMPMHHKHISKAHMYYNRLRGPNTVGYPCTKKYMATPPDAQDPLRDTRSDKIIEKSIVPNWRNLELRYPSVNSPLNTLPTRAFGISQSRDAPSSDLSHWRIRKAGTITLELDNMVNIVPFSAAGNGLLGFGLLGNGGSDGCGDFV